MHEFHGWFVLAETPEEADAGGLSAALEALRARIGALRWSTASARMTLAVDGLVNRIRQEAEELDELVTFLGRRLPGSYGVLYDRADELPDPRTFRVRFMARGVIHEAKDPFLSPTVPRSRTSRCGDRAHEMSLRPVSATNRRRSPRGWRPFGSGLRVEHLDVVRPGEGRPAALPDTSSVSRR